MQGPVLWWLSFCDPDLPSGSQFLGCAIVRGLDMVSAIQEAHRLRCNPGGQVQGQPIYADLARRIPPHRIGVLLDREAAGNVESELLPEGGIGMAITVDAKELEVLRLLVEYGECRGLHLVKVSEARGGNLRRGTVYLTLSDMVDRQLIESRTELGMAQLYYRVTSIGRRAAEGTDHR